MSSQPPTPDYTRESKSASEATPKYYIDPHSTRRPLIQRTFIGTSPLEDYVIERKLGEGTFGEVHKARHIKTRRAVALKRILMHNEKEGIPITAIREIKILKALCHKNVLSLLDMAFVPGEKNSPRRASIYMVTPYMDHDLSGLIENPAVRFTLPQIKCYMNQLLEGMWYLHNNNIIHRDIKAANLLISNEGILKIADFGLARPCESPEAEYTGCVVTRWYRPPELLLGQKKYTPAIDMWGVGCVFGQMLLSKPLIPGKSDIEQLDLIFRLCGSPTEETMPGFRELPGCEGVENFPSYSRRIKDQFSSIDQYCVDLLDKLLILDPKKRYTASDALSHKVFFMDPLPATPSSLPSYESSHEYDRHGFREEVKKPFRNQPDRSPSNHHRRSRQPMNRKPYDNNSNRSSQGSSWRNSRPLGRGNGRKDDGVNPWSKNSIDPKRYPPTAESRTSHNNWS